MRHAPPQQLQITADEARLCEVRDFIDRACEAAGFTARTTANVRLAVDEACTNVIKHAYTDSTGSLSITCGTRGRWFEIRILDHGTAFDGRVDLQHLGELVETKRKGGLGVFLMHRLMDQVQYQTTPAGNEWILRKRLPAQPASDLTQRVRARWALRAALALVLVSLVAVAPLWLQAGRERDRAEMSALRAHAFGLAEVARPVLVERVELGPAQTHLFEAVHALSRQEPRLLSIDVVDNDGNIWAADRAAATFTLHVTPAGFSGPDADGVQTSRARVDGVHVVRVALPVRVGADGSTIGTVHMAMRWDSTTSAIRAARLRLLGGALALDLVVLAFAAMALTAFLRPLQRLVDGMRGLSHDDRALAEDGPEEIGAIAQAFNDIHSRYRAAAENAAEHERLQEEMRLAREIQAAILPQELPVIPGYEVARLYRPAAEVGGDYYDFLDAGAGLTGVVVADVAGKGVPGSMVMGMIRTALRMETRRNAHARDVLARLHQFLAADMRNGMFVTMLYIVLDTRHRVVSYASAGHTPMILYRAATAETFSLAARGMPVGVAGSDPKQFESQLDVERLRLRKGDLLLMYTDGVTEAMNADGEAYGETRLVRAVQQWGHESATEFVRRLEADLYGFLGSVPPGDDLTLVAIKETQDSPVLEGELQRKLVDLVETRGLPVAEACKRLKVSPSTYYRLRGATPSDASEQLPVDQRAALLQQVQTTPEWAAGDLAAALASRVGGRFAATRIESELARLGLGTVAARRSYASSVGARAALSLDGVTPAPLALAAPLALTPPVAPAASLAFAAPLAVTPPPATDVMTSPPATDAVTPPPASEIGAASPAAPADAAPAAPHALVVIESSLDSESCAALGERLAQAGANAPLVIVDLSAAYYVSSRAWGLLAEAAARLRPRGAVALVGMRAEVYDVYRMLGFDAVLPAFADRGAALVASGAPQAVVAAPMPVAPSPTTPPTPTDAAAASVEEWTALGMRVGRADAAGDVMLLALEGVLDTVTAARLDPELETVRANGARRLLVDLSRVDFVSSAGWGELASLAASLRERGGALCVFGMSPAVQRIHGLLHLDAVLPSHDEFASALAALGVADVAAPKPATAMAEPFVSGALRAHIEPYGTSGRASRVVLHGRLAATDCTALASWLEGELPDVPLVLVDARALADAQPEGWAPLGRHARARAASGRRLAVVAAATRPPADSGLAVHASDAAALRERQRAGRLVTMAVDPSELQRDAAVRREGWAAYRQIVQQSLEGSA